MFGLVLGGKVPVLVPVVPEPPLLSFLHPPNSTIEEIAIRKEQVVKVFIVVYFNFLVTKFNSFIKRFLAQKMFYLVHKKFRLISSFGL